MTATDQGAGPVLGGAGRPSQRIARPEKGTPGYELWIAAIEVAIDPPLKKGQHVSSAQVYWPKIDALRAALEGVGIDWRSVKAAES